jgi:hypothetical protein
MFGLAYCKASYFLFLLIHSTDCLCVFLYQLICLSDLEFDYINPYDSSSRINAVVIIEYALQGVLCAAFLLTLNWFPFLVMAPVTYYHVKLYVLLSLTLLRFILKIYMLVWSFHYCTSGLSICTCSLVLGYSCSSLPSALEAIVLVLSI